MITRIFVGAGALAAAKHALRDGAIAAYQDLAPEHANCIRVALPLMDNATPQAQATYVAGLDRKYWCNIAHDDYLTYGAPTARPWVTRAD